MPRFVVALVGIVFIVCAFGPARAESTASPSATVTDPAFDGASVRAKNAGTIEGDVVAVDYRTGTIAVQAGSRRVEIVVLPSTNIAGNDKFHTIADIQKGTHVQVILSRRAGTYIAQIIHLR